MTEQTGSTVPARPHAWLASARRLLEQQRDLLERLDEQSRRQADLIAAKDSDALLSVLGERQCTLVHLDAVGERLEPFQKDWDALVGGLSAPERERLDRLLDDIESLLARIAERDERDRRAMGRQRDRIAGELTSVARGRTALSAYGPGGRSSPMFQDREG